MLSFKILSRALSPQRSSGGFIVVAVLWILAALATLAMSYGVYVNATAFAFADYDVRLKAQELAMAGVELAVYKLTEDPQARPAQGRFAFRLGNAAVAVHFRSESGRIDLNFAPKQLLVGLFTVLGYDQEAAEDFADRIIAWRTPASGVADSEAFLYRTAGKSYGPRRGPFQHVNELGLVLGMTPDLVERALPYLTVYSGQAEVNVFEAAPEVLAALPGLTPARIQLLLAQREGAPQDIVNAHLGMAAQYVTVQSSKANRITVDVRFDGSRRTRSEAVILLLDDDVEPYRVLSWRDDAGERSPDERPYAEMR
ncbi:MAG TPA: type II secretion system protein GspK [Xanthobacteraceae bacterium]|jgi:general secretion pathway protein K|nr:type II secretion system protein GspK [Xanthobacteraceae bacterium]